MRRLEIEEPTSLEEACERLSKGGEGVKLIAGGVALTILMKQKLFRPERLISLRRVPGLDRLHYEEGVGLRIGAGVLHRTLETSPLVRSRCLLLAETMSEVANVRIRNMGTLGGELCHGDPHSDPPPVLIGLGARALARSTRGERSIPLSEFFTGYLETALSPDEVLTEVIVPDPPPGLRGAYLKFTPTTSTDWPCLGAAAFAVLEGDRCRSVNVILGSATEIPYRVQGLEALCRGRLFDLDLIQEVAEHAYQQAEPMSDARGSAWYKKELIRVFTRRALLQAKDGGIGHFREIPPEGV